MHGELVIGPAGSGKTTYVKYKKDALVSRNIYTVNLDPGNVFTNYDFSITETSSIKEYMKCNGIGFNLACKRILAEFAHEGTEKLLSAIRQNEDRYFLFDLPGQSELYVSDTSLRTLCNKLEKEGMRLVVVSLCDCSFYKEMDVAISSVLLSTLSMVFLELPHVCLISKCDNIKHLDENSDKFSILKGVSVVNSKDNFYKGMQAVIELESLWRFNLLDYNFIESSLLCQYTIDLASGYLFEVGENYDGLVSNYCVINNYFSAEETQ